MYPHCIFPHASGRFIQLGVTGSIAAYKACDLVRFWSRQALTVGVTLTEAAARFITPLTFQALGAAPVPSAMFAPSTTSFAHLEPGRQADCFVVAPATANCLARLAHGLADDLLSCQILAFSGPLVIAPAMNPAMWRHPATRDNWERLLQRGALGVEPEEGDTACGDQGRGRLAELGRVHLQVMKALAPQDLAGTRVLVTLGPTREPWDGVRVWTNPSSGRMGAAAALAAWCRGAQVDAVCGPVSPWLPREISSHPVRSAREMHDCCLDLWPGADLGCLSAAVCDFHPVARAGGKFKKAEAPGGFSLEFHPNPDILLALGRAKTRQQKLIGFAAETGPDLTSSARDKLKAKNCDLVLANQVGEGKGFGTDTGCMLAVDRTGHEETWPVLTKPEIAWRMWDWISGM
ncbi:MAG: bifunctional phosphopantothenoylcysteine decarboxylase/phosphopantothenate--cysteine ligase CoaBC [Desulfovibrionales bacterium]